MSWGHERPKADIYTLNGGVLDDACAAMLKAVRVDRVHDVPYVGSCSTDGKTIYIDYELPTHFSYRGKQFDIDRYIVMHEVVEMHFEHQLHFSLAGLGYNLFKSGIVDGRATERSMECRLSEFP